MKLRLRALSLVLFACFFGRLEAQHDLPVTWKTVTGIVDSGTLARLPIQLYDEVQLNLYQDHPDSGAVHQRQIDWAIHQGDTLLMRRHHDGNSKLFRLLYQGEVRLYRVVQGWADRQYYLVRDGQWTLVANDQPRPSAQLVLRNDCGLSRVPRQLSNDYKAVEMTRRINECLAARKHYALATFDNQPRQIGVMFNFTGTQGSRIDDRSYLGRRRGRPVFSPLFSLQYQHQLFRGHPKLKGQLGMSLFHRDESILLNMGRFAGGLLYTADAKETWRFTLLQYQPGVIMYTGYRRGLQLSIGGGGIFNLPLIARRHFSIESDRGLPGIPHEQSIINIIEAKAGYYVQGGIHLRLDRETQLDVLMKYEKPRNEWRYNQAGTSIVRTDYFGGSRLSSPFPVPRAQVRLMFAL